LTQLRADPKVPLLLLQAMCRLQQGQRLLLLQALQMLQDHCQPLQ
jgi:hypothetical protein